MEGLCSNAETLISEWILAGTKLPLIFLIKSIYTVAIQGKGLRISAMLALKQNTTTQHAHLDTGKNFP